MTVKLFFSRTAADALESVKNFYALWKGCYIQRNTCVFSWMHFDLVMFIEYCIVDVSGTDVNFSVTKDGLSALHLVCKEGCTELAKFLLESGAM